ncbi:MAG: phosphopantetheine-binding protein, partial [Cyanobacteria bacterium J06635_11]
ATEYVAPTTPIEAKITGLWQALLDDVEQVGIHDNFFEVGGNSLTAMQLLSQLQNTFSVELTITQLFGALTPAEQAQIVDQQPGEGGSQSMNNSTLNSTLHSQKENATRVEAIPRRQETTLNIEALSDDAVNDLLGQLL